MSKSRTSSKFSSNMKKATKAPVRIQKKESVITMSQIALNAKGNGSFADVYSYLAGSDEHERHQKNSKNIGHALLKKNLSGDIEASQYAIEQKSDSQTAVVREMMQIQKIVSNKNAWFRAKDVEGNKYISRRSLKLEINDCKDEQAEVHYFSPYEYDSEDIDEWSDEESIEIYRHDLMPEERARLDEIPPVTKSGEITLVAEHVRQRDENPTRTMTQNEVMGQSARDAYEDFYNKMKDYLSPKVILILKRAFQANLFTFPENEFRAEWLHKIAHSLSLISDDPAHNPQQKNNLGAAGKWANTEMMILERIAKWFALSEENAIVTLSSFFEMLLGSELIQRIHFEIKVELKGQFIRFIQDIDVLKEYPTFRKTSDLAQIVAISDAIFNNKSPIRIDKIHTIFKKDSQDQQASSPKGPFNDRSNSHAFTHEENNEITHAFSILSSHPEYAVCKRVQDKFPNIKPDTPYSIATIVDLETTGLDPKNEIIEIAMISFAYSKNKGILGIVDTYESLNEPRIAISSEVTQITGITNEQVKGHAIQWSRVFEMFKSSRYLICHNARFDGSFLKQQTPEFIQNIVKTMPFACTLEDINWFIRGYDPRKLDYLNFKLGYFYDAHRALSDCWATLNLLQHVPGAFDELLYNAHKKHLYFFSNPLISSQYDVPLLKPSDVSSDEKTATEEDIHQAYSLLSTLPQYKIYRSVPKPLPIQNRFHPTQKVITIINIKTTGGSWLTDQITEIGVLSFILEDGDYKITDSLISATTPERSIHWEAISEILERTECIIGHNSHVNRKFLEHQTPPEIQSKVRTLPIASSTQDIDWKKWKTSNTSLKYLSFMFGFFFQPDCILSQNYATFNLLKTLPDALAEMMNSFNKKQTILLLTGPFCTDIRDELKNKGFQWSTGSGNMGKGWWACIDDDKAPELKLWLEEAKAQATGKNEIYYRAITPLARYSIRAEFKAADMNVLTNKKISGKRPADEEVEERSIRLK